MKKTQLCKDNIFTVDHFLTPTECKLLIGKGEKRGWQKSSVSGGGHGRTGNEDPVTNSFSVLQETEFADVLWDRIQKFLPENLAYMGKNIYFNSVTQGAEWKPHSIFNKLRLYKYNSGEVFPEHIDYKVKKDIINEDGSRTILQSFNTLIIYLNEDFEKGTTGYWPDHKGIHCRFVRDVEKQHSKKDHQVVITPQTGKAVIQDQNILHEAIAPEKGIKYILRTDIIYETNIPFNPKLKKKDAPREGVWETLFETSCKNYAI